MPNKFVELGFILLYHIMRTEMGMGGGMMRSMFPLVRRKEKRFLKVKKKKKKPKRIHNQTRVTDCSGSAEAKPRV